MSSTQNSVEKSARSIRLKMWKGSFIIACVIYVIFLCYTYLLNGMLTIASANDAIAGTASVMIGFSFAFSAFCYYTNFLDTKIAYRKYLGLVGYWLAVLYTCILVFLNTEKYLYGLSSYLWSADMILGSIALGIFTFMTIISTHRAMRFMGMIYWRRSLRLGYFAYALLIVRAIIIEGDAWYVWFFNPYSLPSLRLVGSVFAMTILFLRGSMIISEFFHTKKKHP